MGRLACLYETWQSRVGMEVETLASMLGLDNPGGLNMGVGASLTFRCVVYQDVDCNNVFVRDGVDEEEVVYHTVSRRYKDTTRGSSYNYL
jgi:hypothetical protein